MCKLVSGAGLGALTGLLALEMAAAGDGFGGCGRGSGFKVDPYNPDQADAAKKAAEAKRARRNAKRALPSITEGA